MKILKFFTPTCMPCRALGKMLDKMEVEVEAIDATENLAMVDTYNVCTTPTLVFLDDKGKEVNRTVGLVPQSKIQEILDNIK